MEIICLGFLLGVVFSLIVFGAGVIYGDRLDKRQFHEHCDRGVLHSGNTNMCNRDMGNVHGQVDYRRCVRFLHEEITGDDMK